MYGMSECGQQSKKQDYSLIRKRKQKEIEPIREFIVMNDMAQVWVGLNGGKLVFSNNFDEAKPLREESKFSIMQRAYPYKLEMLWIN
jgi:hypothetical protein